MQSNIAPEGMVVTPHHLATQSALAILREGGTAMEATVAAASTMAVVYPHMNSIGGDAFWLIVPPHDDPIVIEACGAAGSLATEEFYKGYDKIPYRGPKSAVTVAGTVGGWQEALDYVSECGYKRMSVSRLLSDAIRYAENGIPITKSHKISLENVKDMDNISSECKRIFMPDGKVLREGEILYQKGLAITLKKLVDDGLDSFYRGALAKTIVSDMNNLGIPITESDLANYYPVRKTPLRLLHTNGEIFNPPPPAQGLVYLSTLGILDKLGIDGKHEGQFIHTAVEATKEAFQLRDEFITDPKFMKVDPKLLLTDKNISKLANKINLDKASSIGKGKGPGDTIWIGVMDNKGFSVSFIQSTYHEFGSGMLLPRSSILWNNRGVVFTLEKDKLLTLKPGKKPFHTINPGAAKLHDGRTMIYGTKGGDGQPQTQTAIFHRYVVQNLDLQTSVSAPRWLFGRSVGDPDDSLKLEGGFNDETVKYLRNCGHDVVMLPEYSERVGHAGAIVRHPNGMIEGAFDPRSNGSAAGF